MEKVPFSFVLDDINEVRVLSRLENKELSEVLVDNRFWDLLGCRRHRMKVLGIGTKVCLTPGDGVAQHVTEGTPEGISAIKLEALEAQRLCGKHVFELVVDEDGVMRLESGLLNDVLVEAKMRFPFANGR